MLSERQTALCISLIFVIIFFRNKVKLKSNVRHTYGVVPDHFYRFLKASLKVKATISRNLVSGRQINKNFKLIFSTIFYCISHTGNVGLNRIHMLFEFLPVFVTLCIQKPITSGYGSLDY